MTPFEFNGFDGSMERNNEVLDITKWAWRRRQLIGRGLWGWRWCVELSWVSSASSTWQCRSWHDRNRSGWCSLWSTSHWWGSQSSLSESNIHYVSIKNPLAVVSLSSVINLLIDSSVSHRSQMIDQPFSRLLNRRYSLPQRLEPFVIHHNYW